MTRSHIKTIAFFFSFFFLAQSLLANNSAQSSVGLPVLDHNLHQFKIEHYAMGKDRYQISLEFPGEECVKTEYAVVNGKIKLKNYKRQDNRIKIGKKDTDLHIECAEKGASFLLFISPNAPSELQKLDFNKDNYFSFKTDQKLKFTKNTLKAEHAYIKAAQMHNHNVIEIENLTLEQFELPGSKKDDGLLKIKTDKKKMDIATDNGFYNDIDGKIVAQHINLKTSFYNFGEVCSHNELHMYGNGFSFINLNTKNPYKALVHADRLFFIGFNEFINEPHVFIKTTPKNTDEKKEIKERNILISAKSFKNEGHLEAVHVLEFGEECLLDGYYCFNTNSRTISEETKIRSKAFVLEKDSVFKTNELNGESITLINKTNFSLLKASVFIGDLQNKANFVVKENFNLVSNSVTNFVNAFLKANNFYVNKDTQPEQADFFRNVGEIVVAQDCTLKGFQWVKNNNADETKRIVKIQKNINEKKVVRNREVSQHNGKMFVGKVLVIEALEGVENLGWIHSLENAFIKASLIRNFDLLEFEKEFTLNAHNFNNSGIVKSPDNALYGTILANIFQLDGKMFVPKLKLSSAVPEDYTNIQFNGQIEATDLIFNTDCFECHKLGYLGVRNVVFEKTPQTLLVHGKMDLKTLQFSEGEKADFNLSNTAQVKLEGPFRINAINSVLDGYLSAESITINTEKDIVKTGTFIAKDSISLNANNIDDTGLSMASTGWLNYAAVQELKIPEAGKIRTENIHLEMGKDFILNIPLQMKEMTINAGKNFVFDSPLQTDNMVMRSQGENITINQSIMTRFVDLAARNAFVQQNDVVFVADHGKIDVDSYFFNKTYFMADNLQFDVIKDCINYISIIDIKKQATVKAHHFLIKTLKGETRSALSLPKKIGMKVPSYTDLSSEIPYIFVGDDASFEAQKFENGYGRVQCNKDLTLISHAKFINRGVKENLQGIYVAGKASLSFEAGKHINNAPLVAEKINFQHISTLNNKNLIKADSGIEIKDVNILRNHQTGRINTTILDIKKINRLSNAGIILVENDFNVSNPEIFNNYNTGKINAKSITIDTLKDVLPIFQTKFNNQGVIVVDERFMLDNALKFENALEAVLQARSLDILKIEDVINNGKITTTGSQTFINPKSVNNGKAGTLTADQLFIVSQKEIIPIFKTCIQNNGKIFATEKLIIESASKFENNEDASIIANDIMYEGNIVENNNGFIVGTKNISFDIHDSFANNSTRTNIEKMETLQKAILATQELDSFDGFYTQGTFLIKGTCKTYDNSGFLHAGSLEFGAIDSKKGDKFENKGLVSVVDHLDLRGINNVVNQYNAFIEARHIEIKTKEFTNNGFYKARKSLINAPQKLDHKNGRFVIIDCAVFDFGDSAIDALFVSEGKVVLKGKSLDLNQEVQVKELEIITTKNLILHDNAFIKADIVSLTGEKIDNNGQINGKIVNLNAHTLNHLKGRIEAVQDLDIQAVQTTSDALFQADNVYINKIKVADATFNNRSYLNATSVLYLGHLSFFVNAERSGVDALSCVLWDGGVIGQFVNNGVLKGHDLNLSLNSFEHNGFVEDYKKIKLTDAQNVFINKALKVTESIDFQGIKAQIKEDLTAPEVALNFSTRLDVFAESCIAEAQKIELTSPIIEQLGRLEAVNIIINANDFNNKNFIEAQNLLHIKSDTELHNHAKSYLKSKNNIEIKTALLNNKHVIEARGKLSIDDNDQVINMGKLVSQGIVDRQNISPIDNMVSDVQLMIVTQKLENKGHIFAGSLDIKTAKNGYQEGKIDFLNENGHIQVEHDLIFKGAIFQNASLLDAKMMNLAFQKIINEKGGKFNAHDMTFDVMHLENKDKISAQDLLNITAKKEIYNREKSCLLSEGNIDIKTAFLENKHLIQARQKLSIDENDEVVNIGSLISQGTFLDNVINKIDIISPEIYLTIVTQKLDNKGHIFGGSLNITTCKNAKKENEIFIDCSSALGKI